MASDIPTNTQRNKHVIITSKRRFDVIITCLLRFVFVWMRIDLIYILHLDIYNSICNHIAVMSYEHSGISNQITDKLIICSKAGSNDIH